MSVLHTDQTTFKIVGIKILKSMPSVISFRSMISLIPKFMNVPKKKKERIVHIKIRKNLYCLRNTEKQLLNF